MVWTIHSAPVHEQVLDLILMGIVSKFFHGMEGRGLLKILQTG